MNLKILTSDLPDIKELLDKTRETKRQLKRLRSQLHNKMKENEFLQAILLNGKGEFLEKAVANFFRQVGYTIVRHNRDGSNEDIQIELDGRLTLIEVKGKEQGQATFDDCDVINRYVATKRIHDPDKRIFGIFVLNHDCKFPDIRQRSKTPFDEKRIVAASSMGFGLASTVELVNGYKKLKKGLINFEQFDTALHQTGLIKF